MNIDVEYKDANNNISTRPVKLTRLGFAKHFAIAGQGYAPALSKLFRTLGMALHYSYYLNGHEFDNDRFSTPPNGLSDPTEKGQFSNLVGKAFADYLSKKIDRSIFTVNYEAAMRIQNKTLVGSRPDLIAYCPKATIAIEAKGRSQSTPGNMQDHKTQSRSGPISVNSSVACVSYNLFNKVECKYHDPVIGDGPYDNESLRILSSQYYAGLKEYMNEEYFRIENTQIGGEAFYEVGVSEEFFRNNYYRRVFRSFFWIELFHIFNPKLILPANINELSKTGVSNETKPFEYRSEDSEYLYVDNDRVGLRISE